LKCPHCGFEQKIPQTREEIREFALQEQLVRPRRQAPAVETRTVRCDRCSATFQVGESTLSSACGFCGSPVSVAPETMADRVPPEGVMPFKLTQPQAVERFRAWVRGLWFAPNALKREAAAEKIRGVYRPYWTFDAFTVNHFWGERGDYYYVEVGSGQNRRQERRVRWTHVSGQFTRFFDDVLINAGSRADTFETAFTTQQCKPFSAEFLSGFQAETYTMEPEDGWKQAKEKMAAALYSDARDRVGGDTQRDVGVDTAYSQMTFKLVLLPLYLGAFEFRGKRYQIQINGETGQVEGNRPWSVWKILFAVLLGLAALVFLIWLLNQ
jgi:hypothetical protein